MSDGPITVSIWEYPNDGAPPEPAECIDLNDSSNERLEDLPGIGPAYANEIVIGRPWSSVDDLTAIRGVGNVTVNNIRDSGLVCDGGL